MMYKYYNIKKTVLKNDQCLQRALPIFVKLLNNQIVLDLPKTEKKTKQMSKRLHMIYVEVLSHFYNGLFYHYQNTKSKYYISNTLT